MVNQIQRAFKSEKGAMYRAALIVAALTLEAGQLTAQWRVSQSKDPITDEVTVALMLHASNTVAGPINLPVRPILILRCKDSGIDDVYIVTKMYVGDDGEVQYRFDQEEPITESWDGGRAKDALFLPADKLLGREIPLSVMVAQIKRHQRLVFRWFPPNEDARTATFVLAGFSAIPQLNLRACGLDRATILARSQREAREAREQALAEARRAKLLDSLETRDSTLPWMAERGEMFYFKNSPDCYRARNIPAYRRAYFREERDAEALGYRRATRDPQC